MSHSVVNTVEVVEVQVQGQRPYSYSSTREVGDTEGTGAGPLEAGDITRGRSGVEEGVEEVVVGVIGTLLRLVQQCLLYQGPLVKITTEEEVLIVIIITDLPWLLLYRLLLQET